MITLLFLSLAISIISIIAAIFLIKIKFNNLLRVPLIVVCVAVLLISMFLWLGIVDRYIVEYYVEVFIQNAIVDFRNGKLPPLSKGTTQEEERQIRNIAASIPKGNYKTKLDDTFYQFREYNIEFENGEKYFCAVDTSEPEYRLSNLRKGERKRKGDLFVFSDCNNVEKKRE